MIRKYHNLLLFGILMAVFSSPGQTFLVSLFIPSMRESLGLSAQAITMLYSLSTLLSGFFLPWTGRLFDRAHLLGFSLGAALLLAGGCFLLGVSAGPVSVFIGFFLIRNLGQGTFTLISSTCMAKLFGARRRGRALGISHLGYPLGEILFPALVLIWITHWGWRSGWLFLAGLILFFLLPLIYLLLRQDSHKKAQEEIAKTAEIEHARIAEPREWEVEQALKDKRFYYLLLPVLIPPVFFTALFFHHMDLFQIKGWDVTLIAFGFAAFGCTRAAMSFLSGQLVDRFTARRVFPLNLLPLGAALFCFWFGQSGLWSLIYLGLAGVTMGFSSAVSGALYAEIYGVRRLGALRGITSAGTIFATAAAPLVFAYLLQHFPLSTILAGMLVLVMMGTFSAFQCVRES